MYEAIVIGARCAGSPTAMLLARKGYRVLLLDRCAFPSDTFRNHFIQHSGCVRLHRWGLLERVAASNCPSIREFITDLGDGALAEPIGSSEGVEGTYAPRRYVLDTILVEAAVEAGAQLREQFAVQELLWEAGRVVGVRGRERGGAVVTERARIVIGADGAHSLVAKAVDAPRYDERPALTFGYNSYFSGVPLSGTEVWTRPGERIFINFPTNHGLTCVAMQAPLAGFHAFRADIERNFFGALDRVPELAERVRAGRREERWYGTADLPNFFRKPFGPGWALVGDAGYHKDPILAQGINDAFRDAELLTEAIDAGFAGRAPLEEALAGYERVRNAEAWPTYAANYAAAALAPVPAEVYEHRAALRAAARARGPELMAM
jgi:2-polyprenyl-6-methoxyphenol hydroxylase-like FAD-dependent oxidoreductase